MEKLAYRNRYVKQLVQTLNEFSEADCEDKTPQIISGEDNLIILRVSLEEWTQLYSSVFTGSDICYPETSDNVRWILNRAVECPVSLCDIIADCINTSPGTRQAIIDLVVSNPDIHNYIYDTAAKAGITEGERNGNLLKPGECDFGFVFNQASELVTLLHSLTGDLFDAIEVGTNGVERAQLLVQGAPGIGILPFDELIGLANMLVENVKEEYEGAYDEELYDKLRCDLFCRAKDSCVLTIKDAIGYYEQELPASFASDPFQLFIGVVNFLNSGDFPTDTAVYAMHLFVLAMIQRAQTVLGMDFAKMGLRIIAAGDESDNDWEVLCADCGEIPNVRLEVWPGYPLDTLEFIENEGDDSWWRIHRRGTGHYVTGAYRSVGSVPFYIRDSRDPYGLYWNDAGNVTSFGSFGMDDMPCWLATTFIQTIGGPSYPGEDDTIEILISREPCHEIFLRPRTDSDWGSATFTITFVGFDGGGNVIYDATNTSASGHPRVGFDTVAEDLTTLKTAYLKSATPPGGEVIDSHYHEQAENIGPGAGASGSIGSKKWAFFGMSGLNKTIRVVLSVEPY